MIEDKRTGDGARILVVDDEPQLLHAVSRLLSRAGYEVVEAATGQQGLHLTRETRPDLVLLDVMLPDMDGLEVCRRIKGDAELGGIFVVLLSGRRIDSDSRATGLEEGADDYILRPISNRELLARVAATLRLKRAEEELRQALAAKEQALAGALQATHALRAIEQQYRGLIEQSNDGICMVDEKGKIVEWSRGCEQSLGLKRTEVLGKPFWDVVHQLTPEEKRSPADVEVIRGMVFEFFRTGEATWPDKDQTYMIQRPDGTRRFIEERVFPMKMGERVLACGIIRDVTERVRSEEALRESEAMAQALLNAPTDVAALLDPDGFILASNETMAHRFQRSVDELVGVCVWDLFSREVSERRKAYVAQVVQSGKPVRFEDEREGRWNDNVFFPVLNPQGQVTKVAVLCRDITTRRQAEEKLQASRQFTQSTLDALSDHIAILDEGGFILAVNASWRRFADQSGLGWEDYGVGRNYLEVTDAAAGAGSREAREAARGIREILAGRRDMFQLEYPCHSPEEECWFVLRVTRFESSQGVRVVTSHQDITERKRTEEALHKSEARLELAIAGSNGGLWHMELDPDDPSYALPDEVYLSPRMKGFIGYEDDEFPNSMAAWESHVLPEDLLRLRESSKAYRQGQTDRYELEYRVHHKDGSVRWLRTRGRVERDADGRPVRFAGIDWDVTERKQAQIALRERTHALGERVKELNCLFGISALVERAGISLEEILQGTAYLIPPAWQYPEIACARVILDGREYRSDNFQETAWQQTRDIAVHGELRGSVQVCYREARPDKDEKPFLEDDDSLLYAIATRLGRVAERFEAEAALRESEARFKAQYEGIPIPTYTWQRSADDAVLIDYNSAALTITQGAIRDFLGIKASEMYRDMPDIVDDLSRCLADKGAFERQMSYRFMTTGETKYLAVKYAFVPPDLVLVHTEDITERVEIEEALRESEEKYRDLVENINVVIYSADTKGVITYVSPAIETFLGYGMSELVGRAFAEFIHPEDLAHAGASFQNLVGGHTVEPSEYRVITKSGEVRWMLPSSRPILVDDRVVGVRGALSDVTERVRAQAEASYEQDLMRTLLENVPDYFYFKDRDRRFVRASNSFCDLFKCSLEEIIGKIDEDLFPPEIAEQTASDDRHVIETGTPLINKEEGGESIGGEEHWVLTTKLPWYDKGGNIVGLFGISREITERVRAQKALKRSEERYALAQRAANIGSWDWDIRTGHLYWSDEIEPMFGFARGAFGRTYEAFLECIHPEDRQFVADAVNASVSQGVDYDIEHRIVRPDGTIRWVAETGKLFRDDVGQAARMVGVVRDVTARKQRDEVIRQHVAELATLHRIAQMVTTEADLPRALQVVVEAVVSLFDARAAAVAVPAADDADLQVLAHFVRPPAPFSTTTGEVFPMNDMLLTWQVLDRGRAIVLSNLQALDLAASVRAQVSELNLHALMLVPLRVHTAIIGVLVVAGDQVDRTFTPDEISLAETIAGDVAAAVQNARLAEQARAAAVDAERQRLARELHDSVTQSLYSITLLSNGWGTMAEQGRLEDPVDSYRQLGKVGQQALKEMRLLIHQLRPPILDEVGLVGALQQRLDAVEKRAGVEARLLTQGDVDQIPRAVEEQLYHVAQEALNNALRHAHATAVTVRIRAENGRLILCVEDNGVGFDPSADSAGMGLVNMHERSLTIGGEVAITSTPQVGTTVTVAVALEPDTNG